MEAMERIIQLPQEGNSVQIVTKDIGCYQSVISNIWSKYKQNGKVVKWKHTGRPRKTPKHQDRKQKTQSNMSENKKIRNKRD